MNKTGTVRDATAMIGDVVNSRGHKDRPLLQQLITGALRKANETVNALQQLDVTIGDEFQGVYQNIGDAAVASLLVRMQLLPDVDVRFGFGSGELTIFDKDRRVPAQDGRAWWDARDAIVMAKRLSNQPQTRYTRCWMVGASNISSAVNAALVATDERISSMKPPSHSLTVGLLLGATQSVMADTHAITQSAVSQIIARNGVSAVIRSYRLL